MRIINITIFTRLVLPAMLMTFASQAMTVTHILDDTEIEQADVQTLVDEADVFKSMSRGFAISMAQCEGIDECTPNVNQTEINLLIELLDKRVNTLILRQEENEEDLSEILTAYVDERENYLRYLDQLGEISPEIVEEFVEEEFVELCIAEGTECVAVLLEELVYFCWYAV